MRRPFGGLVRQFRWEQIIDIEGRCGGKAASVIIRRHGSGNDDIRVLIYRRHLGRLTADEGSKMRIPGSLNRTLRTLAYAPACKGNPGSRELTFYPENLTQDHVLNIYIVPS